MKILLKEMRQMNVQANQRDEQRGRQFDTCLESISEVKTDLKNYQRQIEAQLMDHTTKIETLFLEQSKLQANDTKIDKLIVEHDGRIKDLQKELESLKGTGVNSGRPLGSSTTGPTTTRHRPEHWIVDKYCEFADKDTMGADYPTAAIWLKGALAVVTEDKDAAHLVELVKTATPDMSWPGSAMAFQCWAKPSQVDLIPEFVAYIAPKMSSDIRLKVKGNVAKRIRGQVPELLQAKQRRAGVALAGLEAVLGAMAKPNEDFYIPNVFFGGSFSVMIGKVKSGTKVDKTTRPTYGSVLLGTVVDGATILWKNDLCQSILKCTGETIESQGASARR